MKIGLLPHFSIRDESAHEKLSPILVASILHHARFSDCYVVITDYQQRSFHQLVSIVGPKLKIIQASDILSQNTLTLLSSLVHLWSSGKAVANHPPTERLCFLRWFAIRDWLDTLEDDCSNQYLLNDWDDLAFSDPYKSLNELNSLVQVGDPDIASFSEIGLCQWMQPNLTFFTKKSLNDYCSTVEQFVCKLQTGKTYNLKDKGFLDDCLPWAYVLNHYRAFGGGAFMNLLFSETHNKRARQRGFKKYFNTTVRTPENFDKIDIIIPKQYNYTTNPEGLVSFLKPCVDEGMLTVRHRDEDARYELVNLHFTGVESKFALLNGYLRTSVDYYLHHRGLMYNLRACGVGSIFGVE